MAFEREAITSSPIPQAQQVEMREERVLNPYAGRNAASRIESAQAKAAASGAPGTAAPAAGVGQPNTNKSAVAEPGTTADTVTLSPQVAALARKEQSFRQKEAAFKASQAALEKDRAELADLKAMKDALGSGDFSKVEGLVDYEKFSEWKVAQLNSQDPGAQALKKLELEVESVKKAQAEDVSKRFDAAVEERRRAVTQLVASNVDFTTIKELKAEEHVVQHILDTWEHDDVELSVEQAAKEVEEALLEKAKTWTSLTKVKPQTAAAETKELPPLKPGIKTITNNMSAGDLTRPNKSFQGMSDSERYAEARRRAEAKLAAQQRR